MSIAARRRVLALVSDAYGGHGGIAAYNRDVFDALCQDDRVAEVVAVPRSVPFPVGTLPGKLRFETGGARNLAAYLATILRHALSGRRFDLVYCAHIHLVPFAWLAAKLTGAPWMLALYGVEVWKKTGRPITDWLAGRADQYAAISRVTLERFRSVWPIDPGRCVILPNAVRFEGFGPGPKSAELLARYGLEGKTVLMTLGRLDPTEQAKGFDRVIEQLVRLRERVPDIAYLVCGEGGDRPRLEALAARLGVSGRVVFTGLVEEAEKGEHYRLADLYVMPSEGEGFGFVFLEAMACGVPVVASAIDGGREAVREGQLGQIVDPFDAEALEEAILRGLDLPRAVPAGLDHFSFASFRHRLLAAFLPAMRKTPASVPRPAA